MGNKTTTKTNRVTKDDFYLLFIENQKELFLKKIIINEILENDFVHWSKQGTFL